MARQTRDPRTKEELLNKMLSYDFDGDIRHLGENVQIERTSPNTMTLHFPNLGKTYELMVRIPRPADPDEWTVRPTQQAKAKQRA